MNSTGSFLKTVLERVRALLDDASVDAKFDNDFIIRHHIGPAQADVLSRINLNSAGRIYLYYDITLIDGVQYYKLPPCIEQVVRLGTVDTNGQILADLMPSDYFAWSGPGWNIQGVPGSTELYLEKNVLGTSTVRLYYISNGDFMPQYSTGGTLSTSGSTQKLLLTTSSVLGDLDRRENAYAGQVLRLPPASPNPIEERIISRSYKDGSNCYVEVRRPFTLNSPGSHTYEVAPAGSSSLYDAITCCAALRLAGPRKITEVQYRRIRDQYLMAIKTVSDRMKLIQSRVPPHIAKNTIDNPEYGSVFGFLGGI